MVYSEFQRSHVPCLVIEREGASLAALAEHAPLYVEGNAIDDEVLIEAGIERAKGLVNTIPDEADSVYIVLTARQLNPKLHIIARADTKTGEKKLMRAGADRVVLPYEIGGRRMAMASLRPNVVDFMTLESLGQHLGLSIEEVEVFKGSKVAGHTLRETELRSKYGLTVIGIKKPNGNLELHPSGDVIVEQGDILVLIGKTESLEKLADLSAGSTS
jgi:voltage-gated potassium channel